MNAQEPQQSRLLIAPTDALPSAAEVKKLMVRIGVEDPSNAVVEQLFRAAAAADRWLADRPGEATRLLRDPAGAVEEMRRIGLLAEPVPDLLDVLRTLRKRAGRMAVARARVVRALEPKTVAFGKKPALRFSPQAYDQRRKRGGRN